MIFPPITLTHLIVGPPAILFALLGGASLANRPLSERWTSALTAVAMSTACAASIAGLMLPRTGSALPLAFAALSAAILGIVSAFSNRYLHREPGYNRYFVLMAMFATGMLLIAVAESVAGLFAGWEFVGLSSALLVAFFHERAAPVGNALRVFAVYRISDAAMLAAAVLLRHVAGSDSIALLFGNGAPPSQPALGGASATAIAMLLVVAVAAKSGLLPFSGWLPRAMEGPTPSSAVYYGSLSIHAGCFLLLRAGPLLEHSPSARILAGALGASTALFAGLTTRVQSDVKSSLAYAALTQVGLIVVEIALGWYTLAFIHLAGHASFRLLQFLSAPNVLHDLHGLENTVGERPAAARGAVDGLAPEWLRRRLYLAAMERGFLDPLIDRVIVDPFRRLAHKCAALDAWLSGTPRITRIAADRIRGATLTAAPAALFERDEPLDE
jgi:NAD(P)H-quinone oxidoreductase subunit 5